MVTLKLVTSVTVSSPWSSYDPSKGQTGRGSVVNPTYPVFIFDYQTPSIAVGWVVGNSGYSLFSQADANYFTMPAVYLCVLGYANAIGGGGVCGQNNCMQNTGAGCGPWWFIAELGSSPSLNAYCQGLIPSNGFTTHITSVLLDLANQNLLIVINSNGESDFSVFAIPFDDIATALQNQSPSSMKFVLVSPPSAISSYQQYANPATIFDGNLVQLYTYNNYVYIDVIPLSTLYQNMQPISDISNATPVSLGTAYQVLSANSAVQGVQLGVNFNGSSEILMVAVTTTSTFYVVYLNTDFNVTSTYSYAIQGNSFGRTIAFYRGVFLFISWSGTTFYISAYANTSETATTTGYFGLVSAEGYAVIATNSLTNSTVTFNIYQVLLDHTYVFQNVNITVTSSGVTATGTLYDLTTGSPVPNATVYLVLVNSLNDQYSGDVEVLASGTTDSNGNFSITYNGTVNGYVGLFYYGGS